MMDRVQLKIDLERDEGLRTALYNDTVGKATIGIGRNLDDVGISPAEARMLLENDISRVVKDLNNHLPWWTGLSEPRRRALANMAFNLGIGGLLGFKRMLEAMRQGAFHEAAEHALDSKWARQVGQRAGRISTLIREG
jgi:lysozyme